MRRMHFFTAPFLFSLDKRLICCYNSNCKANKCSKKERAEIRLRSLIFYETGEEPVLITETDRRICELSSDEYFYLTENLEYTDKNTVRDGARYLVFNKRRKLLEIVKRAVENELSETERAIAIDYWDKGLSACKIAEKYRMARSSVYRNLSNAENKLRRSLKYVLLYDKDALPQSSDELLNFVKKGDSFEF